MSYIGIIGAKRLNDSNVSLGLIEAQKKAVQLLRCSTDMHMIKQQTGWEMGVDGKWRYEVADPFHNTVEIEDHLKRHFGEPINIRLCMQTSRCLRPILLSKGYVCLQNTLPCISI